ncbi:hypothetical protein IE077_000364 [Cardiosporidium cionae]|uniref:BPL/LPL catalytic domain-containing protein n=1 Tax=Cardiosporidium cionae TaxID=476202 RepID=A0ABQ7JAH9_9APIC|nr:hypothetical protein IE077_000364 [Cardiosporidium cionae]|eukprot:KAF8821018.1 hypothetical protein IE077_000364 [Cardiosporidium cionae]
MFLSRKVFVYHASSWRNYPVQFCILGILYFSVVGLSLSPLSKRSSPTFSPLNHPALELDEISFENSIVERYDFVYPSKSLPLIRLNHFLDESFIPIRLHFSDFNEAYSPFLSSMNSGMGAGKNDKDPEPLSTTRHSHLPIQRIHFDEIDSTQKWVGRNVNNLSKHGFSTTTWLEVSSDYQFAGIGTRNTANGTSRPWIGTANNVYVTYVVPWPTDKVNMLFNIPQIASLAVLKTLRQFGITASLKWINDILVQDKKISGILCQSPGIIVDDRSPQSSDNFTIVLIGIGINVNQQAADFKLVSQPATSISIELSKQRKNEIFSRVLKLFQSDQSVTAQVVKDVLCQQLYDIVNSLIANGFSHFWEEINRELVWRGENVVVDTDNEKISGTLLGIDSNGAIILRTTSGERIFNSGHLRKEEQHWEI